MITFYPSPRRLPETLRTAAFQLQPLTPDHVQIDYAAVMAGREMLNLWSGSPWPAPDFTLTDNLSDLEWHDREHQQRSAFTYTILDPAATQCLGCLYIRPLSELVKDNPQKLAGISAAAAVARFWVLRIIKDDLEREVLQTLVSWFDSAWDFSEIYFHTREINKQQIALFRAAHLEHRFDLLLPDRGGTHQFYRLPDTMHF